MYNVIESFNERIKWEAAGPYHPHFLDRFSYRELSLILEEKLGVSPYYALKEIKYS